MKPQISLFKIAPSTPPLDTNAATSADPCSALTPEVSGEVPGITKLGTYVVGSFEASFGDSCSSSPASAFSSISPMNSRTFTSVSMTTGGRVLTIWRRLSQLGYCGEVTSAWLCTSRFAKHSAPQDREKAGARHYFEICTENARTSRSSQ